MTHERSAVPPARKRQYTIDAGTHSVIMSLDTRKRDELEAILAGFDRDLGGRSGGWRTGLLTGPLPAGTATAAKIRLEVDDRTLTTGRVISTIHFNGGILWRRGSLRIPGIELPATHMIAIKGRTIGDVVAGAPFPEFIVKNAVVDRSVNGNKLRIMCTGSEQLGIPR